ncbi:Aerobic respiration control sensor protein ArcB [Alcanivorax sp. ALC70]|nr:Aerobic respiration control sensor protein ArcB [Alcanivorax sp. ALC70]
MEFLIDLGEGLPEHFYTDRQRLEQIIKNLLSNALKFTEDGSVTLGIHRPGPEERVPGRLDRARTLKFAVTDTGVGIPRTNRNSFSRPSSRRRHHQPQVRRHRPGPDHLPGAGAAAGR